MSKPVQKLNILYCEADQEVLSSQTVAIQKAGHGVQTKANRSEVMDALRQAKFDLVLLGSTVSKNDRHHLPYMVKRANQDTRVLVLHADGGRHPSVDAHMDTGYSVEALIAKINSIITTPAAMAASAGR